MENIRNKALVYSLLAKGYEYIAAGSISPALCILQSLHDLCYDQDAKDFEKDLNSVYDIEPLRFQG